MFSKPVNLFNKWDPASIGKDHRTQEIALYMASRLRAILHVATKTAATWVMDGLLWELVSNPVTCGIWVSSRGILQQWALAHIGMAAAVGHSIDIPIVVRALASHVYRKVPRSDYVFWDTEFLLALDAGDDPDDLDAVAPSYHNQWWTGPAEDANELQINWEQLEACLEHHRAVTKIKEILPPALVQTAKTWARHLADSGPAGKELRCERCRLYRGVSLGVLLNWQDTRHHIEGLTVTQRDQVDHTKRRVAALYQIHEKAILKEQEVQTPAMAEPEVQTPLRPKGKGKTMNTVKEIAKQVRAAAAADLTRLQNAPALKWTWGIDLTEDDVLEAFKGTDYPARHHSGYFKDLPVGRKHPDSAYVDPENPSPIFSDPDKARTISEVSFRDQPTHFLEPPLRSDHGPPIPLCSCNPPHAAAGIVSPSTPTPILSCNPGPAAAALPTPILSASDSDDADPDRAYPDLDQPLPQSLPMDVSIADANPAASDSEDANPDDVFPDLDESSGSDSEHVDPDNAYPDFQPVASPPPVDVVPRATSNNATSPHPSSTSEADNADPDEVFPNLPQQPPPINSFPLNEENPVQGGSAAASAGVFSHGEHEDAGVGKEDVDDDADDEHTSGTLHIPSASLTHVFRFRI